MNCRRDLKAGLGQFENKPLRMLPWATETAEWLCFLERIPFLEREESLCARRSVTGSEWEV